MRMMNFRNSFECNAMMISLIDLEHMFQNLSFKAGEQAAVTRFYECQKACDPDEDYSSEYRLKVLEWNLGRIEMEWTEADDEQMNRFTNEAHTPPR
jgi:hypothetical protein